MWYPFWVRGINDKYNFSKAVEQISYISFITSRIAYSFDLLKEFSEITFPRLFAYYLFEVDPIVRTG